MRKIFLGILLCSCCLAGCNQDTQAQAAGDGSLGSSRTQSSAPSDKENVNAQTEKRSENKEAGGSMKNHKKRYGQMSTQAVFISLKVKNRENGEQAEIVLDNSDWLRYADKIGIPTEPVSEYTQYMLDHEKDVFELPGDVYAKLSVFKCAEPFADGGLSLDQVLEKYGEEDAPDRYWIKDRKVGGDRAFIKYMLDKDCFVYRDCESGEFIVRK